MLGRGSITLVALLLLAGAAEAARESALTTAHVRDGISGFPPSFSAESDVPPVCESVDGNKTRCTLAGHTMRWVWFDPFPANVRLVDPKAPLDAAAEIEARGVDSQGTFGTVTWWECGHAGPTPLLCGEGTFHSVRLVLMESS